MSQLLPPGWVIRITEEAARLFDPLGVCVIEQPLNIVSRHSSDWQQRYETILKEIANQKKDKPEHQKKPPTLADILEYLDERVAEAGGLEAQIDLLDEIRSHIHNAHRPRIEEWRNQQSQP